MYKISRFFLDGFGVDSAFYRDFEINFLNYKNEPSNAIIYGVSGTGKTSFLSAFFTLFSPYKRHFISQRRNQNVKISDYYSKEPTIVASEMIMDEDGLGLATTYLVIGQLIREDGDDKVKRIRFIYKHSDGLKHLPHSYYQEESSCKNWSEWEGWIKRRSQEEKRSKNFLLASTNGKFINFLEEEGIDTFLIQKQVALNMQEHGDLSGMHFSNEEEFLLFFFNFTLDEQKIENSRQQIVAWIAKIIDLPEFKSTLNLYKELLPIAEKLSKSAVEYEDITSKSDGEKYRMHLLYQESIRSKKFLFDMIKSLKDNLGIRKEDEKKFIEKIKKENKKSAYLKWYILDTQRENTNSIFNDLDKKYKEKFREFEQVKCAGALDKYVSTKRRYLKLKKDIEEQSKDIVPLVNRQKECAGALHDAIEGKRIQYKGFLEETLLSIKTIKREIKGLNSENKKLDKKITNLNGQKTIVENTLIKYEEKIKKFKDEKLIFDKETVVKSFARMKDELSQLQEQNIGLNTKSKEFQKKEKLYSKKFNDYEKNKETYSKEIDMLSTNIEDANKYKKRLEVDKKLQELLTVDSDMFDLYLKDYTLFLERKEIDEQKHLTDDENRLKKLVKQIEYIDNHGTGQPDANTQNAINLLIRHGIQEAIYYPSYISKTNKDVQKARKLVESDVGRFMGIAVATKESIDKIKTIKPDGLDKPVSVSLMTEDIENSSNEIVSLMPTHDYTYNQESANGRKLELKDEVSNLNTLVFSTKEKIENIKKYRDELKSFYDKFSEDIVEDWKEKQKRITTLLSELEESKELLDDEYELFCEQVEENEEALEQISPKISNLNSDMTTLKNFIEDYKDIATSKEKIDEFIKKIEALKLLIVSEETIVLLEENTVEKARDESRYREELLNIKHIEEKSSKIFEKDEKTLYSDEYMKRVKIFELDSLYDDLEQYTNQVKAYLQNSEHEQLKVDLDKNKSTMDAHKKNFDEKILQVNNIVDESCEESDIKPFLDIDYKEYEQVVQKKIEILSKEKESAKTKKDESKKELDIYISQQKEYSFTIAFFEELFSSIKALDIAEEALNNSQLSLIDLNDEFEILKALIKKIEKEIEEKEKPYDAFSNSLDIWQETYKPKEVADYFLSDNSDFDGIKKQIKKTTDKITDIEKEIISYKKSIERNFQRITMKFIDIINENKKLKNSEKIIMENIKSLTIDDIIKNPKQIYISIDERIEVMQSHISRLKKAESTAIVYLGNIAREVTTALSSINGNKLPENAGAFAGRHIIKVTLPVKNMADEIKKEILLDYLYLLTESQSIPPWDKLCSDIVKHLLQSKQLNLRLLMVDEYNTSGKMVKPSEHNLSDGQKLIFQVMMYISLSNIRARNHAISKRRKFQGFMVIDNPFGQNTNKETIVPKLELGQTMGIQFIYTMEQENKEMFNLFEKVYILKRDRKMGNRQLVETAHIEIGKENGIGY